MLRLREMRSALEKAKTQGVSMQRRLVLYWFSMALAILAAVLLVVSLTGVFSNTAQKFGQSLTIQKHNTTSALAGPCRRSSRASWTSSSPPAGGRSPRSTTIPARSRPSRRRSIPR